MVSTGSLSPTAETIFFTAMDLFRENGYVATNIRQIAERAGVSLGLVNHYFGSKRQLGYDVLRTLIRYVITGCDTFFLSRERDLILVDATETRAVNDYLSHGAFRQFYLDTLEEDIFFNYLEKLTSLPLMLLQEIYSFTISADMALLYCRYIPYMVEKTLVLKKDQGLFPGISDADVPYHIFISTYSGRVPQSVLDWADQTARDIVPTILSKLEPVPSPAALQAAGVLPDGNEQAPK